MVAHGRRDDTPPPRSWDALEAAIDGEVVPPGAHRYHELSRPFNGRYDDVRPQAIVRCISPHDVVETLSFMRRNGAQGAVRGGGHCFAGHSSTSGVLIDVSPMDTIEVSSGRVRVGGGARLGDVYDTLDPYGLTLPGGTCPTVGIVGLTLGGGLGVLGRSHGVTSDRLLGAEIVLADGTTLSCDAEHHGDLHWALRGAGANGFGVVTSLTFDPVGVPVQAVDIHARWSLQHAANVIDAWQHWAPAAPDGLAASLKVVVPAELERPPRVDLYATFFGDEAEAEHLLAHMIDRARVDPENVTLRPSKYSETRRFWATLGTAQTGDDDPVTAAEPELLYVKSEFFRRMLPGDAIDRLLATLVAPRADGQSRELDFMPWGGAYAHKRPHETAFVHRDETFLLKQSTSIPLGASPEAQAAAARRVGAMWAVTHTIGSGRAFQNFADPDRDDWAEAYYGDNQQSLIQVKARYDPNNAFGHSQSISVR